MAGKTRAEMEQIIHEGGSVSVGGRVISRLEDLPSAAELAAGDPKAEAATIKDIDRQIAALEKQKKQLQQAAEDRKKAEAAAKAAETGGAT